MRNLFGALAILLLASAPCAASDADNFTYLFARTCMQNFYTPEDLAAQMAGNPVLEGESAKYFLGGAGGTAWSINDGSARYVVALRDDSVCAVFAAQAPIEEVTRNFVTSVSTAPPPLLAVERQGKGPSTEHVRTTAYGWSREQDKTELLFTLTTSNDELAPVKAMASVALVAK
jgi:hypothetical protein